MNKQIKSNKITDIRSRLSPVVIAGIMFTFCNILQKGIQFLTTPIFTRLLSTEEYGYYSVFLTWFNIIEIIATLNLSSTPYYNGLLKYENEVDEYTSSLQNLGSINTFIIAIIFSIIYPFISNLIGLPYRIAILMFIVALVNPAFLFWSAQQRVQYKYKALVATTALLSLMMPVLGIILVVKLGMGYEGLVYGYVIANVLVKGVLYIRNIIKGHKFFKKSYWKFALSLSIPLIPHFLSQIVLGQSDRVMINYYIGASAAGIYSLAYQVSLIMNLLIWAINQTIIPWMYKRFSEGTYHKVKTATNQLILLVGVLSGCVMLVAPEIIKILGTREYLDAIWIMPPVMFCAFLMFVYGLWGTVIFYYEKNNKVAMASFAGAIVNVILNIIFIPKFGFIAAAYTTLAGYCIISALYYVFSKNICKEKKIDFSEIYGIKFTALILLCLIVVSVVALLLYSLSPIIRYVILAIIFIAAIINFKKIKVIFLELKK